MPIPNRPLAVYGYTVMYKPKPDDPKWTVDQDDEYRNLPAHYLSMDEALDRVEFMRAKGIEARIAALVAESTDTAEEFKRNRNDEEA
jgi:hypothetical protein